MDKIIELLDRNDITTIMDYIDYLISELDSAIFIKRILLYAVASIMLMCIYTLVFLPITFTVKIIVLSLLILLSGHGIFALYQFRRLKTIELTVFDYKRDINKYQNTNSKSPLAESISIRNTIYAFVSVISEQLCVSENEFVTCFIGKRFNVLLRAAI